MKLIIAVAVLLVLCCLPSAARGLQWLHASGTDIVNQRGDRVVLHGINLGGWLVEEMWMEPFVTDPPAGSTYVKIQDHVSLWKVLTQRYGADGALAAMTAFRNAWVSDDDFARIHDAGLTAVRVPFLYSLADEPGGLDWLDRVVEQAGRHGLYVVLDLHGAPGGQNGEHHSGEVGTRAFFTDPANIRRAADLWARLAERYKNNPTVCAYDLFNEPMNPPNVPVIYQATDEIYQAIRAVDTRHMIIIEEGYTGFEQMPVPKDRGWENVLINGHLYDMGAPNTDAQISTFRSYFPLIRHVRREKNAPFYIGEYSQSPNGTKDSFLAFMQEAETEGVSWTVWTYKIVRAQPDPGGMGFYRNEQPITPLDPFTDSEEAFIAKCAQFRTENLKANPALASAFAATPEQLRAPASVLQPAVDGADRAPGVAYAYYLSGTLPGTPAEVAKLTPAATGVLPTISLDPHTREENFAFAFTGFLAVPTDGVYSFCLASDDGSRLFIGDTLVVDNWGSHGVQEVYGDIGLKAGLHPFTLLYYQGVLGYALSVRYDGPDFDLRPLPTAALWHAAF